MIVECPICKEALFYDEKSNIGILVTENGYNTTVRSCNHEYISEDGSLNTPLLLS